MRGVSAIVTVAAVLSSCAYSLVGRGSALPPGVRSVSIPMFENKTGQPDLDTYVTTAVRDEFVKDGRLKVDDSQAADSILSGQITGYGIQPVAFNSSNIATEYAIGLAMTVVHKESVTGKTLTRQTVEVNWRYVTGGDVASSESQRILAVREVAKRGAQSVVSLVIEAF